MNKFKVGNICKVVGNELGHGFKNGDLVQVLKITTLGNYKCRFKNVLHDNTWDCAPEDLELYVEEIETSSEKVKPKYLRHEVLHGSTLISEMISSALIEHPYYTSLINSKYNEKVDQLFKIAFEVTSSIGKENEVSKFIELTNHVELKK